ncbi:MAG: helix-turn-helix domain-containing protein [Bdellovibrionota bacterium]
MTTKAEHQTQAKEEAYVEITAAAKVIVERVKEFPDLLDGLLREIEIAMIAIALKRTGHNRNQAAKLLGIKRTTLVMKCKKFASELGLVSVPSEAVPCGGGGVNLADLPSQDAQQ